MAENEKLVLGDPSNSSMTMMKHLADNEETVPLEINGEKLVEKTKMFLIAQARNNLNRIIKLTSFMEKLEDSFINAVSNRLEAEPENIAMISMAMETISECLKDANETVTQVIKDDRLQNIIINTTNIITPDGQCATIIDADSRDEVRNVAASILHMLSNVTPGEGTDIVDTTATEDPKE